MLNELNVFIATAEEGSLTAAAQRLDMTIATVSRKITALEDSLGCKLLHRSPRGLSMTPEGKAYFQECADFVHSLNQRLDNLHNTINSLSGPLRVLAPTNLAVGPLDSFWNRFILKYPEIELAVELSNDFTDIKQAQADIAVRIGPQPDSSLIQKKLGYIETILVAQPHKHVLPETISELEQADTVATNVMSQWQLTSLDGEVCTIKKQHQYISNDLSMVLTLVTSSNSVTLMPRSAVFKALESQALIRIMNNWRGQNRDVFLVWPYRRALSVRARAFTSEITTFLNEADWFQTD